MAEASSVFSDEVRGTIHTSLIDHHDLLWKVNDKVCSVLVQRPQVRA